MTETTQDLQEHQSEDLPAEAGEWLAATGYTPTEIELMTAGRAREWLAGDALLMLATEDPTIHDYPLELIHPPAAQWIYELMQYATKNGVTHADAVIGGLARLGPSETRDKWAEAVAMAAEIRIRDLDDGGAQRFLDKVRPVMVELGLIDSDTRDSTQEKHGSTWAEMDKLLGPIEWEWQSWLARGFLTMIVGRSGDGKSYLALRIAASYTRGDPWPDGTPFAGRRGSVVWAEAEAAQALNLERAKDWGLPLEPFVTPLDNPLVDILLDNEEHKKRFEEAVYRDDVSLVVVDSLSGAHRRRENSSEMMGLVNWLAGLARDAGKPILVCHHLRKRGLTDIGDEVTLDRVRGSSALIQPARVIWALDIPDPYLPERLRLHTIKNNLTKFAEPLGFEIQEDGLVFMDAPAIPKPETPLDQVADLLLELLDAGEVAYSEIESEVEGAGLSVPTARRAKKRLGIISKRKPDGWYWALPAKDTEYLL